MLRSAKFTALLTAMTISLAAPSFAGDAEKGEKTFKKCKACHSITAEDGTNIVKGGKAGPNLYGVIGAKVGGHKQNSNALTAFGEAGMVWTEELLATFVKNPNDFIKENGGEGRSKMSFKLNKGGEDVAAYLASLVQ